MEILENPCFENSDNFGAPIGGTIFSKYADYTCQFIKILSFPTTTTLKKPYCYKTSFFQDASALFQDHNSISVKKTMQNLKYRSSCLQMSFEIGVLKNSPNSQKNTCVGSPKACNFIKKRLPHSFFLWILRNF